MVHWILKHGSMEDVTGEGSMSFPLREKWRNNIRDRTQLCRTPFSVQLLTLCVATYFLAIHINISGISSYVKHPRDVDTVESFLGMEKGQLARGSISEGQSGADKRLLRRSNFQWVRWCVAPIIQLLSLRQQYPSKCRTQRSSSFPIPCEKFQIARIFR